MISRHKNQTRTFVATQRAGGVLVRQSCPQVRPYVLSDKENEDGDQIRSKEVEIVGGKRRKWKCAEPA